MQLKDETGNKYGRLVVLQRAPNLITKRGTVKSQWECRCDCGTICTVQGYLLRSGNTRSCGCLKDFEVARRQENAVKHLPEYYIWTSLKRRVNSEKVWNHYNYGGRGITVCKRWAGPHDFLNFYTDMGPRSSPEHSIERRDNSKGYSPENCYWATRSEQARNRRNNVKLKFQGRTQCVRDWEIELGFEPGLILNRIRRGWRGNKLFIPVRKHKPYKPRKRKRKKVNY